MSKGLLLLLVNCNVDHEIGPENNLLRVQMPVVTVFGHSGHPVAGNVW